MDSTKTAGLRLTFRGLLLWVWAGCTAMNAFAAQTSPAMEIQVQSSGFAPSSTAPGMLNLQMTNTLAGLFDNDDCEEDYVGQVTAPKLRGARDTISVRLAKAPVTMRSSDSLKPISDTAPIALTAAREVKTAADIRTLPPTPATPNAAKTNDYVPPSLAEWEIALSDKTLNAAIARWTAIAGWQLLWELPVDYAVEARTTVPGTFEQAVEVVAKSMESAEIPMKAIFYKGNKVLRIVPKGSK